MKKTEELAIHSSKKLWGIVMILAIITLSFTTAWDGEMVEVPSKKSISAMTYNIRFDNPEDNLFSWEDRKTKISQTISSNVPDVIGIQGAYYNQVRWLEDELEVYDWYAVGSGDGQFRGEHCAIFYNNQKYSLLDAGTYWLSNDPSESNATEGLLDPCVMTWVQLDVEGSSETVYIFNTRLPEDDYERLQSAKTLIQKVKEISAGSSFILTGDFNSEPSGESIQTIKALCKEAKANSYVNSTSLDYTFIHKSRGKTIQRRQDYVFFSDSFPINTYEVVDITYNDQYPSDHLPVFCRLRFP